ncbi:hypothetical protein MAHJHV28_46640 [Mycobacterium avium subsp. hominissuis]
MSAGRTPGTGRRSGAGQPHHLNEELVDLDQFMKAVRQIDEFFVQVVRLPSA